MARLTMNIILIFVALFLEAFAAENESPFIDTKVIDTDAKESPFITKEDWELCKKTDWNKIMDDWIAEDNVKSLYPETNETFLWEGEPENRPGIFDHGHRVLNAKAKVMWPDGLIPYKIDAGFSKKDRAGIACGMAYMEKHTCLRFRPKKDDAERPILTFVPENWGGFCMTDWRTNGQGWTKVKLHLSKNSVCTFGRTLVHEFVHGLSGRHTQTRYDRDAHVEIMWDNIIESKKDEFKICDHHCDFNKAFPYDCESIMHYARNQMAKNGKKPTIGKIFFLRFLTILVNLSFDENDVRRFRLFGSINNFDNLTILTILAILRY